jgi:lipopolysaccharide heptosyltransferase I
VIPIERPTLSGWLDAAKAMRQRRYDVALDFQGLLKSAVLSRMSGAARVIGFSLWHLREKTARPFYTKTDGALDGSFRRQPEEAAIQPDDAVLQSDDSHVIFKNLRLLRAVGVHDRRVTFPLAQPPSDALAAVRATIGGDAPFALINPGAAWPNKRWPPERFGEVAAFLREVRGLPTFVLWGPGEEEIARLVVAASNGGARLAPPTRLPDLLALSRGASLIVSGDTGPLHVAGAAGTPAIAIFGPTDPARNGPWSDGDVTISRFHTCRCHYERRCHEPRWCLADVAVAEVTAAIQQRLATGGA